MEQVLELLPHGSVAGAHPFDEGGPFLGRASERHSQQVREV